MTTTLDCRESSVFLTFSSSVRTEAELNSNAIWTTLYHTLLPLAKHWVYAAHIYSWVGQENDVTWDIVLVTIQRTYEYNLKAQGENIPIGSFQRLSIRIARHYFQDLRQKDSRLQAIDNDDYLQIESALHDEIGIAEAILQFFGKVSASPLVDLAIHKAFNEDNTGLMWLQWLFLSGAIIKVYPYGSNMPNSKNAVAKNDSYLNHSRDGPNR